MLTHSKTTKTRSSVTVENLSVTLGQNEILHGVSFEIESGSINAVIGPNGAGKTTLIRAMMGLIPHTSGRILFNHQLVHKLPGQIGYVSQRFSFDSLFPLTVHEFLDLVNPSKEQILQALKQVGLDGSILPKRLSNLSGGQLQRVQISQAIVHTPEFLFLDEPSSGIDVVGEAQFYELIGKLNASKKTTIILVSHDITMISQLVDNVICINKKLMCSGPPHIALTPKKLNELYDSKTFFEHRTHQH